jgi:acetyl-CoA carboxylase biotin carboxyl carrier protein
MTTSKKTTPSTASRAPRAPQTRGLLLGFDEIQTLISLVGRDPIHEFQLESMGVKLHIRKGSADPAPAPAPAQARASAPAAVQPLASTGQPADEPEDPGIHPILSPIVGTFYRAPSTNAPAFVQPGDFVKPGQTLCIVEAMKLMNEIECDVAGEVVAVLAENGQPVEYGERLFTIRVR